MTPVSYTHLDVYKRQVYIGLSVLEISKTLMYDFHYDIMKKKYGEKISLLYTDTDSLFYEIHTEYFYKVILEPDLVTHFDMSDYSPNHPLLFN